MTDSVPCRRCGTLNRPGISFCANCGQRLVAAEEATMARPASSSDAAPCPRCGALNRPGAAFCSECGFNIRSATTGSTAEVAASTTAAAAPANDAQPAASAAVHAWLGPIVLAIAAVGLMTAWFLPFSLAPDSLADQAIGAGGYGLAFWNGYPAEAGFLESAYFGVAAPLPLLVLLMVVLAAAGVVWGIPGRVQRVGLGAVIAWCLAFAALFVVVEVGSGLGDNLLDLLRGLSPAGLIGFLSSVIGAIGAATRMAGG